MNRMKPYLAVVFALMLVVSPGLQAPDGQASAEEDFCGCCQGPCNGCCCPIPGDMPQEERDDAGDECPCDLSTIPVLPDTPVPPHKPRSDQRTDVMSRGHDHPFAAVSTPEDYHIRGPSPHHDKSPPVYILVRALLI
jgi:hypothetical protein